MSDEYEQIVAELQRRVDMLHVLTGIEVSDIARGYALGQLKTVSTALARVADEIVAASGLSEEEWHAYHKAESERQRRESEKAHREWREEREREGKWTDDEGAPS